MAFLTKAQLLALTLQHIKNNVSGTDFIEPVELRGILDDIVDSLKTINGTSLWGGGDLVISSGGGSFVGNAPIVGGTASLITYDSKGLVTGGTNATTSNVVLAAAITMGTQTFAAGTLLSSVVANIGAELDKKQAVLIGTQVTGQNIKTINGQPILGTGDLVVSGGYLTYDAGNGAEVTATGLGVTFTRTGVGQWVFNMPTGVKLKTFNIYTTAGAFFGSNVEIAFNYAGNSVTNQNNATARPPTFGLWDMQTGVLEPVLVSGSGSTLTFRPAILTVGGGNISMLCQTPSGMTGGETLIDGIFR